MVVFSLCGRKQIQKVLGKLNNLGPAELGGAINTVHEGDGTSAMV